MCLVGAYLASSAAYLCLFDAYLASPAAYLCLFDAYLASSAAYLCLFGAYLTKYEQKCIFFKIFKFQFSSKTHFFNHKFQDPSCRICSYGPYGPFWFSVKKGRDIEKCYQKFQNWEKSLFEIIRKMN